MNKYKTVVVVPFGRKRYAEILFRYISKYKDKFDRCQIWLNTLNHEDREYAYHLANTFSWIDILETRGIAHYDNKPCYGTATNLSQYYRFCSDVNTIYIRLDDDIIYIAPDFFDNIIKCRIENPDSLIIYPLVLNNTGISYQLQKYNKLPSYLPKIGGWVNEYTYLNRGGYHPCDPESWGNPNFAYRLHKDFINNPIANRFYINNVLLEEYQHVSINCICWFGYDYNDIADIENNDVEEEFLSCHQPEKLKRPNMICGNAFVSHFAFWSQRKALDQTEILSEYEKMSL